MAKADLLRFLEFLQALAPEGETALIVRQKPLKKDGELQYHADGALKCTWPAFLPDPDRIKPDGETVLTEKPVTTNAGKIVRVRVTCTPLVLGSIAIQPKGDVIYCTVIRRSDGEVLLRTYGWPMQVVVNLHANAVPGYTPYDASTQYRVR